MTWELEDRSLNAWPALRYLLYDGWELRFSGGYTRRANSVNAIFQGSLQVADKIYRCEELYRAQQLPTLFKITPFSQPDTLDSLLEVQGYQRVAETEVRYAPITDLRFTPQDKLDTIILPREQWLEACTRIDGQSPAKQLLHQAIVQAIVPAVCPVVALDRGDPVAVGLGVLERGIVGFFDIFTDERYRRQGFSTRIFAAILCWALENGAHGAYLQVMSDNLPARALYAKMGFELCYHYWYRVKKEE